MGSSTLGQLQFIFVIIAAFAAVIYMGKGPILMRKINELAYGKSGCAPIADIENVTLHYFGVRGRLEPIRLILQEAGIPYREVNFDKETWPKHKKEGIANGLLTFGQVPAMETDSGVKLVQSQAMMHYIGRATGMDCDCEDMHHCEVVALGVEDIGAQLSKRVYNPEFSLKDVKEYLTEVMPMWLGHLEKLAPPLTKQEDAYFASGRLTWVDFLVFNVLDNNIEFCQYDFGGDVKKTDPVGNLPKLANFYKQMSARASIKAFHESDKRFPYKIANKPKA